MNPKGQVERDAADAALARHRGLLERPRIQARVEGSHLQDFGSTAYGIARTT